MGLREAVRLLNIGSQVAAWGTAGLRSTEAFAGTRLCIFRLVRQPHTIPDPDPAEQKLYSQQLQTPNFVHPVSITQLDNLCRHPTLDRLVNSATFLKSQLPARLQNHIHRLQSMPPPGNSELSSLLANTISSKSRGLEVAQDWKLVNTGDVSGLHHFESHLAAFRDHLELEVGKLVTSAQQLTDDSNWWTDTDQVRWLNRMLDLCHWYLLSARVMLTQHSAALAALQTTTGSSSSSKSSLSSSKSTTTSSSSSSSSSGKAPVEHYHEPGHKTTDPHQPYTPPHQQLTVPAGAAVSLVRRQASVRKIVQDISEDCRAFCIEKNSAAPDVTITGGEAASATLVVPYVEFVLTEVLKNAMQAVIARYGAWEVDDAQPVLVEIDEIQGSTAPGSSSTASNSTPADEAAPASSTGSQIRIRVTDVGHGIPAGQAAHMYDYFWSSNRPRNTLYGYSRNHGSQFQGIGVGVPMSRVYAHFMGGNIEWETDSWKRHTTVIVTLPKYGFTF